MDVLALMQAENARLDVSRELSPERRAMLGQFMTPASIATFMAAMFDTLPTSVRLLDAGAGAGVLSAAFVREACRRTPNITSIDVTAFEVDTKLAPYLKATLAACAEDCRGAGVAFRSKVLHEDFVMSASTPLFSENPLGVYDCAILNPPYAKIRSDSSTRAVLRTLGIETSNLYTAFVALALELLRPGGQLVAITPRSFCNGPYFEPFRHLLLSRSALKKVHLYESRRAAFGDDDVLQENVVFHVERSGTQPATVRVTSSFGPQDPESTERDVPFDEIVLPGDARRFIRITISNEAASLAQRVRALPCTLADLDITASTGRVVDFRARAFLRSEPEPGSAPLIYPCHFHAGTVAWPLKESRKPNALVVSQETLPLFVPRGTYVLTKRFSSKEERRRLVAVVYDPEQVRAERVGFENHLNYLHHHGSGLPADVAKGLVLFLNSTAVDQYFRQFSGHTQVNATDLRSLHYPNAPQLVALGSQFGDALPDQGRIDQLVNRLL